MGPIYLINKKGQRRAVHFHFTAWGMKNEPNINPPSWNWNYEIDNKVGIEMWMGYTLLDTNYVDKWTN